MSFRFQRAEESPGFLLWQLSNQWQRQQRRALAPLALTHPQFLVLASILWLCTQSSEKVTQQMLVSRLQMDKMSISDLVTTLIRKKLLRRVVHSQDQRAYSLRLTEKGHRLVLIAIPVVEEVDASFFTHLTPPLLRLLKILQALPAVE